MSFQQAGRGRSLQIFQVLILILGGVAGSTAQERLARPSARLVASVRSERTAPSRPPSPPTKVKDNAASILQAVPPRAAQPLAVTPEMARMEQRAFALINEARTKAGLAPLVWDEAAAKVARAHSGNMANAGFFSHIDPEGRDTAARARELGVVGWRALGENIAYNKGYDQPADFVAERWLQSAKHYANITQPLFTHSAVGACVGPDGRAYFTQIFLAR